MEPREALNRSGAKIEEKIASGANRSVNRAKLLLIGLLTVGGVLFVKDIQAQGSSVPGFFQNLGPLEEGQIETHTASVPGPYPVQLQISRDPNGMVHLMIVTHYSSGAPNDTTTVLNGLTVFIENNDIIEAIGYQAGTTPECVPGVSSGSDLVQRYEEGPAGLGEQDVCVKAAPLPVELTEWIAKCSLETGKMHFRIDVASQVDNEGWTIEYSDNGENWEYAGFVAGDGTTTEEITYEEEIDLARIEDANHDGQVYFRLEQRDFDGATSLSDTKVLDLCGEESDEIVIAPNPTKGTFTLTYPVAMENEEAFEVKIYTSSGQLVADGIYIEGNGSEEFDMTNLPNGVYLVAVGGAGKITHAKVVKN